MSDAPIGPLQRAARRSLLGALIAGLGVFPAAWLVVNTASVRQVLRSWGAQPSPTTDLGSARVRNESLRLLDKHHPAEALARLEPQLERDPGNAQLWCNACIAHGVLGNRGKAVAACSRAVALEPFTRLFVNNLAWVRSLPQPHDK